MTYPHQSGPTGDPHSSPAPRPGEVPIAPTGVRVPGFVPGAPTPHGRGRGRRPGAKRIITGVLGVLANTLGLLVIPLIGAMIGGMMVAGAAAEHSTSATPGEPFPVEAGSFYFSLPADEAEAAGCELLTDTRTGEDISQQKRISFEADAVRYRSIFAVKTTEDANFLLNCAKAPSNILITPVTDSTQLVPVVIGAVIPVVLLLICGGILVWGVIVRVRSGRGVRPY